MSFLDWFLDRKAEERSTDEQDLAAVLSSTSGDIRSITKQDALNIPAVASAVRFVSETVGGIPVKLYKREENEIVEVEDDYRLALLNRETGDLLDANQCRQAMVSDILLDGAGYVYINKRGNKIRSLHYVDSNEVSVLDSIDPIFKTVKIMVNGKEVPEYLMMRSTLTTRNGCHGLGALKRNPVLFRAMFNALKYESSSLSSGAKRGFLKSKYKLEQSALDKLKEGWRRQSANTESNDVIVLNEGISFEPTSSTATETQLQQNKTTNSNLVNAMFGLPENLFTNPTEDVFAVAVKMGILPVLSALETAYNKFLLLEREKDAFFFRFDSTELLKKSLLERSQSYEIALRNGWLQVDEIRKRENLPALGLEFVKLNLGDVLYNPKTKEIYTANTNATVKMDGSPIKETQDDEI